MEYILYYNRQPVGYKCYEKSEHFPEACVDEVQKICNNITEPASNAMAFRYAPLRDKFYLLSVIFRQPHGSGTHLRGVNTVVNFLMTGEETDNFFADISYERFGDLVRRAEDLLAHTDARLVAPELERAKLSNRIPEVQLMTAASYAGMPTLSKQAYFGVPTSAVQEVVAMMKRLPRKLRRLTSFHTSIQNAQESIGIAVNFCTPDVLENAWQNGMTGGMNSTKYLYYVNQNGESGSYRADKDSLPKYKKMLDILDNLPYPELSELLLVENAATWQEFESVLKLDTSSDFMGTLVHLISRDLLLNTLKHNLLSEHTIAQMVQCKTLPTEIYLVIFESKLLPEQTILKLVKSDALSETVILIAVESGVLSESGLRTLEAYAKNHRMKLVVKAAQKELRTKQAASALPEYPQPPKPARSNPERRAHRDTQQSNGNYLHIAKVLVKVALVCAAVWCGVALVKSLLTFSNAPAAEESAYIVIGVNTAKMLWKVFGLAALSAAISSFVTCKIIKWSNRKKEKAHETTK